MTGPAEKSRPAHLTLRLDEALVEALKRVAENNDRSVSAEARLAIRHYLRTQQKAAA